MRYDETMRELMDRIDEGVYFVDLDRRITFWNRGAEKLSGYASADMVGFKCSDNLLRHITPEGRPLCGEGCPLAATMQDGDVRDVEVYMHHKDGSRQPVAVRAAPLSDQSGNVIGAIEVFSDRRDRREILKELESLRHEVLTDSLTGLGNRRALEIIAKSRLEGLEEGKNGFALIMADIDHFKKVNDTYGHEVGDRVLKMVASSLGSAVRPLDAAIRWGGEEFVLLCPNMGIEALAEVAERVRVVVEHSWINLEDGSPLRATISVGAARASKGEALGAILGRADARLYEAKRTGRNRCVVGD